MTWLLIGAAAWTVLALSIGILIGKTIRHTDKRTVHVMPITVTGSSDLVKQIRFHARGKL